MISCVSWNNTVFENISPKVNKNLISSRILEAWKKCNIKIILTVVHNECFLEISKLQKCLHFLIHKWIELWSVRRHTSAALRRCKLSTHLSRVPRILAPVRLRLSEGDPFDGTGDSLPAFLAVSLLWSSQVLLRALERVSVVSVFSSVWSSALSNLFAFSNSAEMSVTLWVVLSLGDLGDFASWFCTVPGESSTSRAVVSTNNKYSLVNFKLLKTCNFSKESDC